MAHWQDIGGILNGMTFDIYSEGLQIPHVKYHSRGKLNVDVREFIKMNVRRPDRAMGDLEAQLSACRVGAKHLQELMRVVREGDRGVIFFTVQRGDGDSVSPADMIDPVYGRLLRLALDSGVEALAYRALVTSEEIRLTERLPVVV